jgi:hypothetical protein
MRLAAEDDAEASGDEDEERSDGQGAEDEEAEYTLRQQRKKPQRHRAPLIQLKQTTVTIGLPATPRPTNKSVAFSSPESHSVLGSTIQAGSTLLPLPALVVDVSETGAGLDAIVSPRFRSPRASPSEQFRWAVNAEDASSGDLPAHLAQRMHEAETPRQTYARVERCKAYFRDGADNDADGEGEQMHAVQKLLQLDAQGQPLALEDDELLHALSSEAHARADQLGLGFEAFDPRTHMVVDGLVLTRPQPCPHWVRSDAEQRLADLHASLQTIEFGARTTRAQVARTHANRFRREPQRELPVRSKPPAPHAAFGTGNTAAAPPLEETQEQQIHRLAREKLEQRRTEMATQATELAQAEALRLKLAQREAARHGPVWLITGRSEHDSHHRAAHMHPLQPRPQSARMAAAVMNTRIAIASQRGSNSSSVVASAIGSRAPSRPQTARPSRSAAPSASPTQGSASMAPQPPASARPASASVRPSTPSAASNSLARGGRGAVTLAAAREMQRVNEFVLLTSLSPHTHASGPRSRSKSRSRSLKAQPTRPASAADSDRSFINAAALSSKLTSSIVQSLLRERPRSAMRALATPVELALPTATLRTGEAQGDDAAAGMSRRPSDLQPWDDCGGDEGALHALRREQKRAQLQATQQALLAELLEAAPGSERHQLLLAQWHHSSPSKRPDTNEPSSVATLLSTAPARVLSKRKMTPLETRMHMEEELSHYAATRPVHGTTASLATSAMSSEVTSAGSNDWAPAVAAALQFGGSHRVPTSAPLLEFHSPSLASETASSLAATPTSLHTRPNAQSQQKKPPMSQQGDTVPTSLEQCFDLTPVSAATSAGEAAAAESLLVSRIESDESWKRAVCQLLEGQGSVALEAGLPAEMDARILTLIGQRMQRSLRDARGRMRVRGSRVCGC